MRQLQIMFERTIPTEVTNCAFLRLSGGGCLQSAANAAATALSALSKAAEPNELEIRQWNDRLMQAERSFIIPEGLPGYLPQLHRLGILFDAFALLLCAAYGLS